MKYKEKHLRIPLKLEEMFAQLRSESPVKVSFNDYACMALYNQLKKDLKKQGELSTEEAK